MAVYDVKLTDQSTTVQNPDASARLGFGDVRGDSFSFGGINDSPRFWPFVAGAVGLAIVAGAFWWFYRKRT